MAKDFSVEYKATDWLDPKQLDLSPEDVADLATESMFRSAYLDLRIRVVPDLPDKEFSRGDLVALQASITKATSGPRQRLRKEATKTFSEVINAWRVNQNPGMAIGDEAKKALDAVKKLDSEMKDLVRTLPRDLRDAAGKALGVSADDFYTINESDYDIELRTDLMAGLKDNDLEDEAKEQNEKLKARLSKKGTWLNCCVVWLSADIGRLLVAKPDKPVKVRDAKDEGKLLDETKVAKKSQGKVYVTGAKLRFQFLEPKQGIEGGPLPGGKSPEAPLKKLISRQTGKQYNIKVYFRKDYTNKSYALDDGEAPDNKSDPKGSVQSESGGEESSKQGRPTKIDDTLAKMITGLKTKEIEEVTKDWKKDDAAKLLAKMTDKQKSHFLPKAKSSSKLRDLFQLK